MWDAASLQPLLELAHASRVLSVSFSGGVLATAAGDVVRLWDSQTGACLRSLEVHTNRVSSVLFAPEAGSLRLLSTSWDTTARVWDVSGVFQGRAPVCLRTLRHAREVNAAAWSADGALVATAPHEGEVRLWDAHSASCLGALGGEAGLPRCSALCFAADGTMVGGFEEGTLRVWGFPPVFRWLGGLRLEAFYDALCARRPGLGLRDIPLLTEHDLLGLGMADEQVSRFLDYASQLAAARFALSDVSPFAQLQSFLSRLLAAEGEALPEAALRGVCERLRLATVVELGAYTAEELRAGGIPTLAAAQAIERAAEDAGYGEVVRQRRGEERERRREAGRLAGITARSQPAAVAASLERLAASGPPPTASAFFVCHSREESETAALALAEELVAASDEVLGFCVDEAWVGHQTFASDEATEEAMLAGVTGASAFLLLLTRGTLARPYCLLECRAAMASQKPVVVVHEGDPRLGGAEFEDCLAGAPADVSGWLRQAFRVSHRRRKEERHLMVLEVFKRVDDQGGVFHALLSIAAHAELLAELAALRRELANERLLVEEFAEGTLVSEISMLKAELDAAESRAAQAEAEVGRLQAEACEWEEQLGRSLEREREARADAAALALALEGRR